MGRTPRQQTVVISRGSFHSVVSVPGKRPFQPCHYGPELQRQQERLHRGCRAHGSLAECRKNKSHRPGRTIQSASPCGCYVNPPEVGQWIQGVSFWVLTNSCPARADVTSTTLTALQNSWIAMPISATAGESGGAREGRPRQPRIFSIASVLSVFMPMFST